MLSLTLPSSTCEGGQPEGHVLSPQSHTLTRLPTTPHSHPAYKRDLDAPEGPRVFDPEKLTDGEIKAFLSKHPDIVGAAIAAAQTAQAMAQAKAEYEREGVSRASV